MFPHPLSEPDVRLSRKVGAGRPAGLGFPTPPSEPAVQVSLQRALQELAFRPRPYGQACHPVPVRRLPPKVRMDFTTLLRLIGSRERQLPGSLRPVASFPSLRLLWSLRLLNQALVDGSPLHPDSGLPRSYRYTQRDRLGLVIEATQAALCGIPCGDVIIQVTRLILWVV